jgi:hypothetical protein
MNKKEQKLRYLLKREIKTGQPLIFDDIDIELLIVKIMKLLIKRKEYGKL